MNRFQYLPSKTIVLFSTQTSKKKVHPLDSPEVVRWAKETRRVLRGNKERQIKPKRVFCLFSFSISDAIDLRPKCFYGASAGGEKCAERFIYGIIYSEWEF
ncbi:hypothetical protein CDAR_369031 [Caerostris darwini]|uniref:Uncharacterized protein n=1 Tax=Caerostris darwini TaxID=1538125 RepID=A0AAV4PJS8_9ARAC|nr:hypothetical protein CDAR_369031 [Caerostris darwini]